MTEAAAEMRGRSLASVERRTDRLARRQVGVTLLAAVAVGLVLNATHVLQDVRRERERMEVIASGVLALIEPSAARAAYTYDATLAETVVRSLTDLPSVTAAWIDDHLGRVLASDVQAPQERSLRDVTNAVFGERMVRRRALGPPAPPRGADAPPDAPIGVLTLELDTRALAGDLLARSIRLFALGLLKTALLAFMLAGVVHMLVTRPLSRLAAEVDVVAPDQGDSRVRCPPGHERDELGRVARAVDELLDRFRRADALREVSDRRFRAAVAGMPDGLAIVEADGTLAFMNAQYVENSPAALQSRLRLGRRYADCLREAARVEPFVIRRSRDGSAVTDPDAWLATERDDDVELPDGRILRVRLRRTPGGGRVVLTSDVTQRRRMAEGLRRAEKLGALGTLAGGVAHDFNNLLATIFSAAELALARQPEDGPARPALERILAAGRRGRAPVEQVMAFSRAEREPGAVVDLGRSVEQAVALVAPTLGETVAVRLDALEAPVPVAANDTQIHQLVSNLVTNAAEAMKGRGEIRVSVRLEGGEAVLRVEDDGPGMDAETRRRAFEPFYTTKSVGEGSGLGLAVVYGVVRSLDGRIGIESAPGAGTTVIVRAPLAVTESAS